MITLYTTPNCPQCMMTKKFLDRRDITYQVVALETDPAARAYVMDTLGYKAAPVVTVTNKAGTITDHWSGFQPDRLAEYAPAVEEATA